MIRFEEDKRLTPLSAALAASLACLVPLGLPPVSRHHASAVALANKNSQNLLQLNAFQVFPSKRARAEAEPGWAASSSSSLGEIHCCSSWDCWESGLSSTCLSLGGHFVGMSRRWLSMCPDVVNVVGRCRA